MSRPPDNVCGLSHSEKVSKVMDEIGVNERLVMKRRRTYDNIEQMKSLAFPIYNSKISKVYNFGSQTEGSTTIGIGSDTDTLFMLNDLNVIQSISEKKPDANNLLMLQHDDITPGYCHLQYVEPDEPSISQVQPDETLSEPSISQVQPDESLSEPSISYFKKYLVHEHRGQMLLNNSAMTMHAGKSSEIKQCGPAFSQEETSGFTASDQVLSYYCESQPLQATSWLQKLTKSTWPSEHDKQLCRNAGCFVVPVGSKASKRPEIEWRVSTCLQERYLMFSLNITQLRCYVLMKIVLKAYVKPYIEDVLTSFMCKNVLFYHIAASSHDCHEQTLIDCLLICLQMLKECVKQRNCPHFIIPENNLLAGKLNDEDRDQILDIFDNLMKDNDAIFLFNIEIESIDLRMRIKYDIPVNATREIPSPASISMDTSGLLLLSLVGTQTGLFKVIMCKLSKWNVRLDEYVHLFNNLNITMGEFMPAVISTLGSVITCRQMENVANTGISEIALNYLVSGSKSDALSGRMKLASVLYCTGDLQKTETFLKASLEQFDISRVETICGCYFDGDSLPTMKYECIKACDDHDDLNEMSIENLVSYCTVFLPCEINCIPQELGYELWRHYSVKNIKRKWTGMKDDESWMELIVADSLPYLYYLQYKVYGHLKGNFKSDKQQALKNLIKSIDSTTDQFHHKETSLNLLGQCLEQEQRYSEALGCYISSIKHRPTNNAARLLMCLHLFSMRKKSY